MTHPAFAPSSWSTASFGDSAGTSPREQSALGAHLGLCQNLRGRLHALHCLAESTHGLLAARFVTTLVVLAAVLGAASLML